MPKFRKKPVVIEAVQFLSATDPVAFANASEAIINMGCKGRFVGSTLRIKTLEGEMTASPGDWIIKGVNGEFYPCKPDIFEKTYEAVEDVPA